MSSEVSVQVREPAAEDADVVVAVNNLTKTYEIYRRPHHRLLQWWSDRHGLDRHYPMTVHAVEDVTFQVRRGETVVVLGRNGSGKSTVLQMIAGTLTPTSGSAETVGRVSALLELGAGFNPDYTGRENLRLNARIFGLTPEEIEAAEPDIERFADIGPFIDEPVRTYSSGMYVRLAFATAVHLVPDVLIVDEALAVGDVFFQQKCMDHILNRMAQASKLIVTHDVATASRLADRVLVMDRGRLVFDGPPLAGVEFFTSINLRDRAVPTRDVTGASGTAPARPTGRDTGIQIRAPHALFDLPEDKSSNPEQLRFVRYAVGVGNGADERWYDRPTLKPGDPVRLFVEIDLAIRLEHPIFGYLVRDRVGNVAFGQNTVGSGHALEPMDPGRHRIELEVVWPELAEGDYTITIGAGEGQHPLHHFIVSWAQNIISIVNTPQRPVHGVFNTDIEAVRVAGA